jgi:hypothetical protein
MAKTNEKAIENDIHDILRLTILFLVKNFAAVVFMSKRRLKI